MNPFVYPKSRHIRTQRPGSYSSYARYKPYLRDEFERKCVYCRMPDTMRGNQSYGVDHYRPKKLFPALATTYSNLFYCCNPCNSRKGSYWPAHGQNITRFIPNPCDHEMFPHLRFKHATVEMKSPSGKFTCELLDLNAPEAVSYRELILRAIITLEAKKKELQALSDQIQRKSDADLIPPVEVNAALGQIREDLENIDKDLRRLVGDE